MSKFLLALAMLVLGSGAWADGLVRTTTTQWQPPGPIKIVVPYAPGGSTDKWARVVGKIFSDHGWKNYIENKPGADTTIASNLVAESAPDGTTLYLSGFGYLDANLAFKQRPEGIRYNKNSFTDIVPLGSGTLVLAVANHIPVNNYKEFKEYVRKNPRMFNLGFFNRYIANTFYVWAKKENLPEPNIIMYKGSAPLDADLIGGQIPFAFDTYNTIAPFQLAGKVKVIAVLDSVGYDLVHRANPGLDLFNIAAVYPELAVPIHYGVAGPAGMLPVAVAEINRVVNRALKDPKYTKEMEDMYLSVKGGTPADLTNAHVRLLQTFKNVAKEIDQ
jgi:tripartite-type tricarboxylate transporter receptor subunit TctC